LQSQLLQSAKKPLRRNALRVLNGRQRYKTRFSIGHLRKNPKAGYPKFSDQPSQVRERLMELCQEDIAIYERFSKQPRPERRFGDLPKVA
jgi:hypothetical protein